MADSSNAMDVDETSSELASSALVQATDTPQATPRPVQRKPVKYSIDLQMPLMVCWPDMDNKLSRSLREHEQDAQTSEKGEPNSNGKTATSNGASGESKKEIPLPGVAIRPEYEEETPEDFKLPEERYLQFVPPSWLGTDIHLDRERLEYCIDDEDINWISDQRISATELDEEAMEILLDILEKESFRQLEFRQINAEVAQVIPTEEPVDEDDKPCSACGGKDWDEDNLILFCDGCDLPIHQSCQDLARIPEGDWFCDTCVYRMVPSTTKHLKSNLISSPSAKRGASGGHSKSSHHPLIDFSIQIPCAMCGMVDGGPFKKTHLPGRFVHICCALMSPDVWFDNDCVNVSRVIFPAGSRAKPTLCSVCGFGGGLVKCTHRGCNVQYHVTCARENGQQLLFNVPDPEEQEDAERAQLQEVLENSRSLTPAVPSLATNLYAHSHKAQISESTAAHLMKRSSPRSSEDGDVDIDAISDDESGATSSLNTSTMSMPSEKEKCEKSTATTTPKKKKKRKRQTVKKTPHQPFQSLCAMHSGIIRAEKLEQARKASLEIPVDVGRFLKEEEEQHPDVAAGETTTFSKAVGILRKLHSSGSFALEKRVFDRVVTYWKAKRLARRLGHMPFIFQLHVLVTHFKEDFDAGRRLASEPRQVEMKLAQYTMEKKFELLRQLRDSVEILRTTLDLVKKREIKKRQSMLEKLQLFDLAMEQEDKAAAIRALFAPAIRGSAPSHPFLFTGEARTMPMTIRLPVSLIKRVLAPTNAPTSVIISGTSSRPTFAVSSQNAAPAPASPPPKKKPKLTRDFPPYSPPNQPPVTIAHANSPLPTPPRVITAPTTSSPLQSTFPVLQPKPTPVQTPVTIPASHAQVPANGTVTPLVAPQVPVSPPKQMSITSYFSAIPKVASPPSAVKYAPIPSVTPIRPHETAKHSSSIVVATPITAPLAPVDTSTSLGDLNGLSEASMIESTPSTPRSASLSSPMATPTKLSNLKPGAFSPTPLATSSPKPISPTKLSPYPIHVVEPVQDAFYEAQEEEHILFNSGLPRSSLFDAPTPSTESSSAMQLCNE